MKKKKLTLIVILMFIIVVLAAAGVGVFYYSQDSLVLKGDKHVTINLCGEFEDPGFTANKLGREASAKVKVDSTLDTQTAGDYVITYTLGHLKAERQVTVTDKMDPVIELSGEANPQMKLGEEFEEPGYTATDDDGTDLTAEVSVEAPDFNRAEMTAVTYKVTDRDGNTTVLKRSVEVLPNTDYDSPGLPICMYHYVYDEDNPPDDLERKYANYIKEDDLIEEFTWLKEEGYYFPTWPEVRDYIDGKLLLPEKSIVITFDDAQQMFLEYGVPIIDQYEIPATCFIVTKWNGPEKIRKYTSDYLIYESHSHNMHRGGGDIGHGGIFTALSKEDALEDLQTSIDICGSGDAFAYPYGDYDDQCVEAIEEAGFLCAMTTVYGKAYPGMNPLLLPRVRMSNDQSMSRFKSSVSP